MPYKFTANIEANNSTGRKQMKSRYNLKLSRWMNVSACFFNLKVHFHLKYLKRTDLRRVLIRELHLN